MKRALIVLAMGLGLIGCNRDLSSPAKALEGHWRSDKGRNWCFEPDGRMMTYSPGDDRLTKTTWENLKESPQERSIRISFLGEIIGKPFEAVVIFSEDGRRSQAIEPITGMTLFNFEYVGRDTRYCGSDRG